MSKNRPEPVTIEEAEANQALQRLYPNQDGRGYYHAILILRDLFAEDGTEAVTKERLKASFLKGEPA